jgi:U3 small nucleolar RNA-associated protein 21
MATANGHGSIALWDLNDRRLVHLMESAHDASIHSCFFLNGMNVMVTASNDNSIKQWAFDSADGVPRLLKSRTGHHKPPTKIMYYGPDGHSILSAGQDQSLRYFSVIRDAQNTELSQGRFSSLG